MNWPCCSNTSGVDCICWYFFPVKEKFSYTIVNTNNELWVQIHIRLQILYSSDLFKTSRINSENLTIFQPDIEYLRQRGSSVSARGPSLSLVNSKLEAVMEQHVLTAKGSTFILHCSSRLPDKDGASAYHRLKSHSLWSLEHTGNRLELKKTKTCVLK